jgi:gliding motility-associated-like protein
MKPYPAFVLLLILCSVKASAQSVWRYKEKNIIPVTASSTKPITNNKTISLFDNTSGSATTSCPYNLDVETGTFANWHCFTGSAILNSSTMLNTVFGISETGPLTGRHQIINKLSSPTTDYYGNFPRLCPNGSKYSIQLGNASTGAQAESITYSIPIPSNNNNFVIAYNYAVVFQNPNHSMQEQPRFRAKIYDSVTNQAISCASFDFTASSGLPGFYISARQSDVLYKPWTTVTINLSGFAGHTVKLEFTTEDCTLGGHFGYAYIDINTDCNTLVSGAAYCSNANSITLTAPYGYQSYNWYDSTYSKKLGTGQTLTLSPPPPSNSLLNIDLIPYAGFGCRDTAYTHLSINTAPKANFTVDNSISCQDGSVNFTNYSTLADTGSTISSYHWDFGNNNSSTAINTNAVYTTAGIFNAKLLVQTSLGCVDSVSQLITIKAKSSSVTNMDVCSTDIPFVWNGDTIRTAGTYIVHLTNAVGCDSAATLKLAVKKTSSSSTSLSICSSDLPLKWNGNNYSATGTYIVHLTNAVGCDSAATLNLTIKPVSTSTTNTTICTNALPYLWNGNSYSTAGTYTVHLTNAVGCDSAATLILSTFQNTPSITINASTTTICKKMFVQFDATTFSEGLTPTYKWKINGNAVGNSSQYYTDSLVHNDIITCELYSSMPCLTASSVESNGIQITVLDSPKASFNINDSVQPFSTNTFIYTNTSINTPAVQYAWDFGDSRTSTFTNPPVHQYAVSGFYTVKLTATNHICAKDTSRIVLAYTELTIPNAFSPNNDGINDYWDIKNLDYLSDFSLNIFDREGHAIYSSKESSNTHLWDGTRNGQPVPLGTYYYVLDIKRPYTKRFSGWVMVIR